MPTLFYVKLTHCKKFNKNIERTNKKKQIKKNFLDWNHIFNMKALTFKIIPLDQGVINYE